MFIETTCSFERTPSRKTLWLCSILYLWYVRYLCRARWCARWRRRSAVAAGSSRAARSFTRRPSTSSSTVRGSFWKEKSCPDCESKYLFYTWALSHSVTRCSEKKTPNFSKKSPNLVTLATIRIPWRASLIFTHVRWVLRHLSERHLLKSH